MKKQKTNWTKEYKRQYDAIYYKKNRSHKNLSEEEYNLALKELYEQ